MGWKDVESKGTPEAVIEAFEKKQKMADVARLIFEKNEKGREFFEHLRETVLYKPFQAIDGMSASEAAVYYQGMRDLVLVFERQIEQSKEREKNERKPSERRSKS